MTKRMAFERVIREVTIDGVQYGMWVNFDIDADVYEAHSSSRPWKYQNYITRNKNKMRRRIRISRNDAMYSIVREAFINRYVRG